MFDRKQYLRQLHLQKYYLTKFIMNYTGGYFKNKCLQFLKEIEEEIEVQQNTMLYYKNKYSQERFDI